MGSSFPILDRSSFCCFVQLLLLHFVLFCFVLFCFVLHWTFALEMVVWPGIQLSGNMGLRWSMRRCDPERAIIRTQRSNRWIFCRNWASITAVIIVWFVNMVLWRMSSSSNARILFFADVISMWKTTPRFLAPFSSFSFSNISFNLRETGNLRITFCPLSSSLCSCWWNWSKLTSFWRYLSTFSL